MKLLPQFNLPYLEGSDLGKDIPKNSLALALALEKALINAGLVPGDIDVEALIAAIEAARDGLFWVEAFGAVGDGVTDDTAAIQRAADAVRNSGGGTIAFRPGRTYGLLRTVELSSNTFVQGNLATIQKLSGGTSTSFVNRHAAGVKGYGSGAQNITFENLRILGNYSAGVNVDFSMGFHHVDNLNFFNCTWEQGMMNAHCVDLGACRNVKFEACNFFGMNPGAGREYVEAIQVDSSSFLGSSWKTWPLDTYDGLPTRNVVVMGSTFRTLVVNGTTYPMPNPMGQHGSVGNTDAAYYEDIRFIGNLVEGFNTPVSGGSAYGWLHFRGVRGMTISGNTFKYTGPSGVAGNGAIISILTATSSYKDSDVALADPATAPNDPIRYPVNVKIVDNDFIGFSNGPFLEGYGIIHVVSSVTSRVAGNTFDGTRSTAIYSTNDGPTDGLEIQANRINAGSTRPCIVSIGAVMPIIDGNIINGNAGGTGIQVDTANGGRVINNSIFAGAIGILFRGTTHSTIAENMLFNQTTACVSIGPSGFTPSNFDTAVVGNRARATATGAVGLLNGPTASRTAPWGNFWSANVPKTDNGAGTVAGAYADR